MKDDSVSQVSQRYWRTNLRIVGTLLSVWFIVSFGLSILCVDELNTIRLGGFRLGFWMAQQGSMYVFVTLIFVYVWLMNRLDRAYDLEEQEEVSGERGVR